MAKDKYQYHGTKTGRISCSEKEELAKKPVSDLVCPRCNSLKSVWSKDGVCYVCVHMSED